jgi:hypothetical protein
MQIGSNPNNITIAGNQIAFDWYTPDIRDRLETRNHLGGQRVGYRKEGHCLF